MNKLNQSNPKKITAGKQSDIELVSHDQHCAVFDQRVDHFERTVLDPVDYDAFFATLDAPPKPTEALRLAFKRYRHTVVSRE